MQSDDAAPDSFALQSEVFVFKSFKPVLGALSIIVAIAAWQAYLSFDDYFEWILQPASDRDNLLWLCAGPLSFLLAGVIGLLFAAIAATAKHSWTKKFWFVLLWLPLVWLAMGSVAFTWLDYMGKGLAFTFSDHLGHNLSISLPMAADAACLLNAAMLVKNKPSLPLAVPANQWDDIGAAIGRLIVWIGASAGSVLVAVASALLLLLASCSPPSLNTLANRFPHQRHDLEALVQMSDQDSGFSVIDPGWLETTAGKMVTAGTPVPLLRQNETPAAGPDPEPRMSVERWNEYRGIFRRNNLTQGIRRSGSNGDAFLIVKSEGLLDNGVSNGFVYCGTRLYHAYPPCSSNAVRYEYPYTNDLGAYSYIKLADRWYAFSQGPG